MREFQAKKRIRRILYSRWVVVLLVISLVPLARATWSVYLKERESATNMVIAQGEFDRLKDRENVLKAEINRLSTEQGIEEEIRSKYSVVKPGEELVVIIDNPTTTATGTPQMETWWSAFTKLFR